MLKDSFDRGAWTKERRNFVIAIVILTLIVFAVSTFFSKDETPIFDPKLTKSDSAKIDSLVKTLYSAPTAEDDSMYKAYKLDELDSLMMSTPTSPLVDSLLKDVQELENKKN